MNISLLCPFHRHLQQDHWENAKRKWIIHLHAWRFAIGLLIQIKGEKSLTQRTESRSSSLQVNLHEWAHVYLQHPVNLAVCNGPLNTDVTADLGLQEILTTELDICHFFFFQPINFTLQYLVGAAAIYTTNNKIVYKFSIKSPSFRKLTHFVWKFNMYTSDIFTEMVSFLSPYKTEKVIQALHLKSFLILVQIF